MFVYTHIKYYMTTHKHIRQRQSVSKMSKMLMRLITFKIGLHRTLIDQSECSNAISIYEGGTLRPSTSCTQSTNSIRCNVKSLRVFDNFTSCFVSQNAVAMVHQPDEVFARWNQMMEFTVEIEPTAVEQTTRL